MKKAFHFSAAGSNVCVMAPRALFVEATSPRVFCRSNTSILQTRSHGNLNTDFLALVKLASGFGPSSCRTDLAFCGSGCSILAALTEYSQRGDPRL